MTEISVFNNAEGMTRAVCTAAFNWALAMLHLRPKKEMGNSGFSYPADGSREQHKKCGHFRIKAQL